MATDLLKKLRWRDVSVTEIPDPALQTHYTTLEAVALDQDEDNLPEIEDKTLPNPEVLERADFFTKIFKKGVFGKNYEAEEAEAAAAKEGQCG